MKQELKERLDKISKLTGFDEQQISLLKNTVAKGTNDMEFAMFGSIANYYDLNPLNKEIWCFKDNKNNLIIFAGRDGFLRIAQRDSRWNGIASSEVRITDTIEIDIPNGKIIHKPNLKEKGKIIGAYCFIKPKGCEIATIEWVDFETYDRKYNVWKSHPADMIKKVAEIKALKKAFGISGLHDENNFSVQNDKVLPIDTETEVEPATYVYIETLLSTSTLNDEEKQPIERELENGILNARSEELILFLKQNQLSPKDRGNMSQTEILEEIKFKTEGTRQ